MQTLQALVYIERHDRTGRAIWNYATGTLKPFKEPDSMLNRMELSISTAEKCAPMQVVNQPEHGKASTREEQKCSSFQTNYD